jgi:hypothetical protein
MGHWRRVKFLEAGGEGVELGSSSPEAVAETTCRGHWGAWEGAFVEEIVIGSTCQGREVED